MQEPAQPPTVRETDGFLYTLERAEKRVVAVSFLLAKILSVGALLVALLLLETGVVKRIWETEFHPGPVHAQAADSAPSSH